MHTNIKSGYLYWQFLVLMCILSIQESILHAIPSAITYQLGDRLGDNLAAYCHARWLSYLHKLDFVYVPFKESDKFVFSLGYRPITDAKNDFKRLLKLQRYGPKINARDLIFQKEDMLYRVPYFAETHYDAVREGLVHFDIDWDDEDFMKILRSEISLINPLPKIDLPKDRITVAVHVRRGSGKDRSRYDKTTPKLEGSYSIEKFPLRFPHDTFFIEHIKRLSEMLNDKPMYVHIFTDDKNAPLLIEKYAREVGKSNIVYNSRSNQLNHEDYVLQDFFDIMSFDCIIRPESHYSLISSRLSHARIVIRPEEFLWKGRDLIITKAETILKKSHSQEIQ